MRFYDEFPRYVPVGARRRDGEKTLKKMQEKNPNIKPVVIVGRTIATTWWGKSWNGNLERYADFSNRIGRGRSYVRNGAVLDLQIAAGQVTAVVQGSRRKPYEVVVTVDELRAIHRSVIRKACEGHFDTLGELLAGNFPQGLRDLFFSSDKGLFPAPKEIHFECSCPDWASMCKHVAAVLYGIGARLDKEPSLFFTLRNIDIDDLISHTVTDAVDSLLRKADRQTTRVLKDVELGDVFGIDMVDPSTPKPVEPVSTSIPRSGSKRTVGKRTPPKIERKKRDRRDEIIASKKATIRKLQKEVAALDSEGSAGVLKAGRRGRLSGGSAAVERMGDMAAAVCTALGTGRRGKSIAQLQKRLGWTEMQIRNAISRARAKGIVETVSPGVYRRSP